jgi:hypothetical protein
MNIQEVIQTINQMQADGVIDTYAIGGAVGATFHLEPVSTLDVDIFVSFRSEPDSLLISPRPIYDYLTARGCAVDGEYLIIADWPVQFLPPTGPLAEEALAKAVVHDVDGVPARVFTAEYLAAIALQTGRAKDKARLLQFIESGILDAVTFEEILTRHALTERWALFQQQFLSDTPS